MSEVLVGCLLRYNNNTSPILIIRESLCCASPHFPVFIGETTESYRIRATDSLNFIPGCDRIRSSSIYVSRDNHPLPSGLEAFDLANHWASSESYTKCLNRFGAYRV